MAESDVAGALRGALAARRDVAERPDRCRALLGDLLGTDGTRHRREVSLLVAAVEEHVPEALREATTPAEIDRIALRFREDRLLDQGAARWTVDMWSDALRSVGVTSIPETQISHRSLAEATSEDLPVVPPTTTGPHDGAQRTPVASTDLGQVAGATLTDRGTAPVDVVSESVHPQRPRRVALLGAIAVIVVIAVVVAAVVAFRGDNPDDTATEPTATTIANAESGTVDIELTAAQTGPGTKLQRKWALRGERGDVFVGELAFTKAKNAKPAAFDEVIPKSLAKRSKDVKLDYDKDEFADVEWVRRDPVLRVKPKAAQGMATLRYEIKVAPRGTNPKRLDAWKRDAQRERAAWEKATKTSSVEIMSPAYDAEFTTASAPFAGTTKPGTVIKLAGTATTIGGPLSGAADVSVNAKGIWLHTVPLAPGANWVKFEAFVDGRLVDSDDIVVYYNEPQEEPRDEPRYEPPGGNGPDDPVVTTPPTTANTAPPKPKTPTGGTGGGGGRGTGNNTAPPQDPIVAQGSSWTIDPPTGWNGERFSAMSLDILQGSSGPHNWIDWEAAQYGYLTWDSTNFVMNYEAAYNGPYNDSFRFRLRNTNTGKTSAWVTVTVYVGCNYQYTCA
jgi:hypothetical protein